MKPNNYVNIFTGIFAVLAAVVLYSIIAITLPNGISCDEGNYLMGYLPQQDITLSATNYHYLIRCISGEVEGENIMWYRYFRFVFSLLGLLVLAISSYKWLTICIHRDMRNIRWQYYSCIFMAGAMAFTFGPPTISYDSLLSIFVPILLSLLFWRRYSSLKSVKYLASTLAGCLSFFAFINYPPSTVLIIFLIMLWWLIEGNYFETWRNILYYLVGVMIGGFVCHLFVFSIIEFIQETWDIVVTVMTEKSMSRHDSAGLIGALIKTIGNVSLVYVSVTIIAYGVFYVAGKANLPKWLPYIIGLLCLCPLLVRSLYEYNRMGYYVVTILAIISGRYLHGMKETKNISYREFLLSVIFIFLPIFGVWGTNQPMIIKALILAPSWVVAYYILRNGTIKLVERELDLAFVWLFFFGYVWLGNFHRYQYYYTPRSSKIELKEFARPQEVKVNPELHRYLTDVCDTLNYYGCKTGDYYLAFGEHQIIVYLNGGFIAGNLPYHWWQYKDKNKEVPKAVILFKKEENDVITYMRDANWDFPKSYYRTEMRPMATNMGEELRTVLYIKKQ